MYYLKKFHHQNTITIGYARVSSTDSRQELGLAVQKEALGFCDILFVEKDSGANNHRPKLERTLQIAKLLAGHGKSVIIVIYKLDRLTRRMFQLLELLQDLSAHHIQLKSLQENIDTHSLTGKLLCLILGYVAEMELENIRFRTKEGLQKAKSQGKRLGNPGIKPQTEEKIVQLLKNGHSPQTIAQTCGVARSTVYNVKKRNFHKITDKSLLSSKK